MSGGPSLTPEFNAPYFDGLTPKQILFVIGYCDHWNATQALLDAGYNCKSRDVARSVASEYLAKPNVAAALDAHVSAMMAQMRWSKDRLTLEFWANVELARKVEQVSAANAGLQAIAQLHGISEVTDGAKLTVVWHDDAKQLEMGQVIEHKGETEPCSPA